MNINTMLLTLPAYQLAQLVRTGQVTSAELVSAAIARIKKRNPKLNAVISLREEAALKEARQLKDTGQPFLGVPILLKGLGQALAGEPDTNGNKLFKDHKAETTSNFVRALQEAGFIIVGQTNFPEFGFKNRSDDQLYGPVHNPWAKKYTPGGSSGGSAAALADGWVPIAAGNDGGGSIRIPAAWTGLIGLKPTRGRVPTGPDSWRSWQGASINFALTRTVKDTAMLLDQLQTVQPAAVFQTPKYEPGFANALNTPLPKITIGYTTKSPLGTPVSPEAKAAVLSAVDFLRERGFRVQKMYDPVDGAKLMRSYYLMNGAETAAMFQNVQAGMKRPLTKNDMELYTWALWQMGKNVSAADYSRTLALWDQTAYQHVQMHEFFPLFLTPTNAQPAPRVDYQDRPEYVEQMKHMDELTPGEQRQLIYDQCLPATIQSPFTEQANMTGEPAISLPTGMSKQGTPMGIQFIANKGREDLLLQVARLFEEQRQFKLLNPVPHLD
ncbi:amidase [Limosilactobacillus sp.]|jgi:amidase|uniref:amidase n=1 Tax=Limosilactobacillus sp. TaxID=2773925 RepID=UPI0025C65070|nr:amidase [Limosilactobacillus sp.]MCH3922820.1 amidase [Limosilactobacillus sp.]MCH3927503.1 amidase [Limosilactobacillus sp.]